LLGYGYAHLNRLFLKGRAGVWLHLAMVALACCMLPVVSFPADTLPPLDAPYGWIVWHSVLLVGVPFFVLSASAPLLQGWADDVLTASRSGTHSAYGLYAVSNLGSFAALLAFPLMLEPLWGTTLQ